jgi:hypothetical protein
MLSDGGHKMRRLPPGQPAAVRCSAWLGHIVNLSDADLTTNLECAVELVECGERPNTVLCQIFSARCREYRVINVQQSNSLCRDDENAGRLSIREKHVIAPRTAMLRKRLFNSY